MKIVGCNVTKMVFSLKAGVLYSKVYELGKLGFVVPFIQIKA
jgi:hypothetical protein